MGLIISSFLYDDKSMLVVDADEATTYYGFPSLWIFEEEVHVLATPFKFALIWKFSFHRPPLDAIQFFF
ncbi:hypothetical protein IEQ34_022583 [Dendrobium chrysotoxum]|uniref:Uncharacterized protein n=1 Tax=Dendrobium chrysotoxum TaxID=161865 RepID=A0AAV7FZA7_DENCH|nr:hypothetical protein IEQ34_022583 [Dendrobium chrysotoxum]